MNVAEQVDAYLSLVDAEAPGLVEGLYLEGSVALGDFRPPASDVDFVAVTAEPADPAVLARVHARLGRQRRPVPRGRRRPDASHVAHARPGRGALPRPGCAADPA